jgi:ribosomal protein L40E
MENFDNGGNMMFCRKCGGKLPADALFCVRCGERVRTAQPEPVQAAQPVQPPAPLQAAQPVHPAPAPMQAAQPVQPMPAQYQAAQTWQPDQGMPAGNTQAQYAQSQYIYAGQAMAQAEPKMGLRPWLVVLISAVGTFLVFGAIVLVILNSVMK